MLLSKASYIVFKVGSTGHNLTLFDFLSLCKSTWGSSIIFLYTLISHLSSTNILRCFIITVYMFFVIFRDGMPHRWGTL